MKKTLIYAMALLALGGMQACDGDGESVSLQGETRAGAGGSLARFAIQGDHLYVVDDHALRVFGLGNPTAPTQTSFSYVGVDIETIFPRGDAIFIGSSRGMHIFSLDNPSEPQRLGWYEHVTACDPVVADDQYAYVTLRSGPDMCNQGINQLDVVDIRDLSQPRLLQSYPMSFPKGLGLGQDTTLFVCDDGLKVFTNTDPRNLRLRQHFDIAANDVIPYFGNLIVVGNDGIYQYDYLDRTLRQTSHIPIVR